MWLMSTDCLLGFLDQGGAKKSSDHTLFGLLNQSRAKRSSDPVPYYHKLKFILQTLRDFFYADGNGLTGDNLENSRYKVCNLYRIFYLSTLNSHDYNSST